MRGLQRLRSTLQRPVSVGAVLELATWLAVPYFIIGVTWAFLHAGTLQERETYWNKVLPAGADIAALGEATVLWPALLLLPAGCTGAN
ncbi:hypothetical protein [Mycobacterium sp. 1423905.2]|uniref:hypothetical protein n=1 Tax=Mycobacterium sp. 1423905.2 TaxID=1856859 RepID=UPI0007FC59F4|nr:hypothetical protein [Mycobacterium sp. 1423905.2]OBJ60383.1 hypothetical protein A9W95_10465 [Mycobacterium sp. 1423905.2]